MSMAGSRASVFARCGRVIGLSVLLIAMSAMTASARTILVTSSGHPIGGKWQHWVDAAKVPTYQGRVVLEFKSCPPPDAADSGDVVAGEACTYQGSYVIYMPLESDYDALYYRNTLYHELGHIFNYSYLTGIEAYTFARIWGLHPEQPFGDWWWYGSSSTSDVGLGSEWFAEGYRLCADYGSAWTYRLANQSGQYFDYGYAAADASDPAQSWRRAHLAVRNQLTTCRLIRRASPSG